jgi:hypothetical protein
MACVHHANFSVEMGSPDICPGLLRVTILLTSAYDIARIPESTVVTGEWHLCGWDHKEDLSD